MNKQRRKQIDELAARVETCGTDAQMISDEETEAKENLPESIQYSEKGDQMEENISDLDQVASDLEDLFNQLQEIAQR